MSWQTYVDANLVGTKKVTRAAIVGLQGGVWASSPGYTLSTADVATAIQAANNPDATKSTGVTLHEKKFIVVQTTDRSIYGKKQADGVVIVKTKQSVLVAEYDAPVQGQEAISTVESLADYLISVNY